MLKPVAMTTPNPVRRPSSATMSAVRASEIPWGAATTTPGRPIVPESRPGTPPSSETAAFGTQPDRRAEAVATLIVHQHRLRERIAPFVRQGEQHPAAALPQSDLPRPARQDQGRGLGAARAPLELAPGDAELQPRAQRLESRLLGGEPRREVRRRVGPRATVGDLSLGEDAAQEPILPAVDHLAHPRDADQVDPDAGDRHGAPSCAPMSPARSSAIARIRSPSAPSIMTRASGSGPEYRMRTRPRPAIPRSKAATRSATPAIESIGGFDRTGTLTSTWGNLRRTAASAASGSPVSAATGRSGSAERIPSPAGAGSRNKRRPRCPPPRFAPRSGGSSEHLRAPPLGVATPMP